MAATAAAMPQAAADGFHRYHVRMASDVLSLIPRRSGHFRMASGLHSDLWLDLESALADPRGLRPHVANLARQLSESRPDVICGPLIGGACIAMMLAEEMGVRFCYAEKLPGQREYTIAPPLRAALAGQRAAVVDDAIQAGS